MRSTPTIKVSQRSPNSFSSSSREGRGVFSLWLAAVKRHADRIGAHGAGVPIAARGHVFAIGARLQHAIHGGKKIIAVQRNVESDQVGAQQSIQQLGLPRANAEGLRVGPRECARRWPHARPDAPP